MIDDAANLHEYRISKLESNLVSIDGKMDDLMTNHLPHLESKMISLETKINTMTAINLGAIIMGIVIQNYVFK